MPVLSPVGSEHPYYAEFGWSSSDTAIKVPTAGHAVDRRPDHGGAGQAGAAHLGQRPGPGLRARHRHRRILHVRRQAERREQVRQAGDPVSLEPCRALRPARGRGHLHPARRAVWRLQRQPEGVQLLRLQGRQAAEDHHHRRLARHYRQILDGDPGARPEGEGRRHDQVDRCGSGSEIPDRLCRRRPHHCARRQRHHRGAPVRRRQDRARDRRLREEVQHRQVRSHDRLGLVLVLHQAAVLAARVALRPARQFRPVDPGADRDRQGGVLPAGQQVLCGDEQDEGAAAGDGEAQGALRRGPPAHEPGADAALSPREGQSGGRLPAHRGADPGVLRALQGALHHHRDAPSAVLRLDQGSERARSAHHPDRLRPVPLAGAGGPAFLQHRPVAHHHGRHDVPAAEAEPAADRSGPGARVPVPAHSLHLHAGLVRGRPGDLLGVEQHAVDRPAIYDHAPPRHADRRQGQAQAGGRRGADAGSRRWRGRRRRRWRGKKGGKGSSKKG